MFRGHAVGTSVAMAERLKSVVLGLLTTAIRWCSSATRSMTLSLMSVSLVMIFMLIFPRVAIGILKAIFLKGGISQMGKPKIFCYIDSMDKPGGWYISVALAESGQVLCSHASTTPNYAKLDIGYTNLGGGESLFSDYSHLGPWKDKRRIFDEHYPHGYDLVWIDAPWECNEQLWLDALSANDAQQGPTEKQEAEECQA